MSADTLTAGGPAFPPGPLEELAGLPALPAPFCRGCLQLVSNPKDDSRDTCLGTDGRRAATEGDVLTELVPSSSSSMTPASVGQNASRFHTLTG